LLIIIGYVVSKLLCYKCYSVKNIIVYIDMFTRLDIVTWRAPPCIRTVFGSIVGLSKSSETVEESKQIYSDSQLVSEKLTDILLEYFGVFFWWFWISGNFLGEFSEICDIRHSYRLNIPKIAFVMDIVDIFIILSLDCSVISSK
jgi:hypothetical protein